MGNILVNMKNLSDENESKDKYLNIVDHLKIFNLLNEIFYYKRNNNENEYVSLNTEIKDLIEQVNNNFSQNKNYNFSDLKRKLDVFRNNSSQDDVVYQTVQL